MDKWHIRKVAELGWTLKASAEVRYQQLFGLDVSNLALSCLSSTSVFQSAAVPGWTL